MNYLWVGLGSALGGMARYGCSGLAARHMGVTFPWGTLIVTTAREHGLAGATVLRGLIGYGCSTVLHTAKLLDLSDDLPMVVEIVDSEEKIQSFLPVLDKMMSSGLITLEKVRVLQYGSPPGAD